MKMLERAGKLSRLAGLVVGGFTEIHDKPEDFGKAAYEIIDEAVQNYDFPVCFGFPSGHMKDNRALIMGRKARLSVDKETSLDFF